MFDRVLLTVHPTDCAVRDHFAHRLAQHSQESDLRGTGRVRAVLDLLGQRFARHRRLLEGTA